MFLLSLMLPTGDVSFISKSYCKIHLGDLHTDVCSSIRKGP